MADERTADEKYEEMQRIMNAPDDEDWEVKGLNYDRGGKAALNHAIFQTNLSPEMLAKDETVAAMQSLIYDETTPDERAKNWKETGNEMLSKKTPAGYKNAIEYYCKALDEELTDMQLKCQLLNNRSQAHLYLENYGYAMEDAWAVLKIEPDNVKAAFRGAKAAAAVKRYDEVVRFCDAGLEPVNAFLEKRGKPVPNAKDLKVQFLEMRAPAEKELAKARALAEKAAEEKKRRIKLAVQLRKRKIRLGPMEVLQHEIQGGEFKQEFDVDEAGFLSVPCALLYDECNQSDYIERVAEDECIMEHLEQVFPCPWDPDQKTYSLRKCRLVYLSRFGTYEPVALKRDLTFGDLWRRDDYFLSEGVCILHVLPQETPQTKEFLEKFLKSAPGSAWEERFNQFQYENQLAPKKQ